MFSSGMVGEQVEETVGEKVRQAIFALEPRNAVALLPAPVMSGLTESGRIPKVVELKPSVWIISCVMTSTSWLLVASGAR